MSYPNLNVAATPSSAARLSPGGWLIYGVVTCGFVFDAFEIVVMPITVRPALTSLGLVAGTTEFNRWVGLLLYLPAVAGGLVGLFGGQLIDAFGRRRPLIGSLLLYSFATMAAATAWSPASLLVWRCFTLMGVALEFVAALTYLAELFSAPKQRDTALGYAQVAYGAGNFVVTAAYYGAVTYAAQLPALAGHHDPWRYTLAIGMLPSIPVMMVRSRLPESPLWNAEYRRGASRRPGLRAIFRPGLRLASVSAVVLAACVYAGAYGVLQHVPRLVPGLPDVRVLPPRSQEQLVSVVHLFGSFGEIAGRLVFAIVVAMFVRQRRLLRLFAAPAIVMVPTVFIWASTSGVTALKLASFIATFLVTAQFSFLGNYLPRLFPTRLRGTGESFAINVGGRLVGSSAAFITPQLAAAVSAPTSTLQLAYAIAIVAAVALGTGCAMSFWMPEPKTAGLPE